MLRQIRKLLRNERGVAAMEFAFTAPPLMLLFVGLVEVSMKLWSTQKAEKLTVTISDVVAQAQTVTVAGLRDIVDATDDIMEPFDFGDHGKLIISSVYREQGERVAKVNWQCIKDWSEDADEEEDNPFPADSKVGDEGDDAVLPAELTLNEKENVIVAEVFYRYEPILPGLLFGANPLLNRLIGEPVQGEASEVIYRRALFKPRLGALTNSPGDPCTL
jgi:TadE-like protein